LQGRDPILAGQGPDKARELIVPSDPRVPADSRAFDGWAETYDQSVRGRDDFPFLGYDAALEGAVAAAVPKLPCSVLDLGIGTGNLAKRFAELGC